MVKEDTQEDAALLSLGDTVDLTVIIVSYNTAELTAKAVETLYAGTHHPTFHCVVFDNASADGSARLIAERFPQVEVIASDENLGFARANNKVASMARTEWILLLNPDTEVHDGAVDRLMQFAAREPQAGIWGGRTVFPDGSLNIASCWGRPTAWSLLCRALGFTTLFKRSEILNPEAYGDWKRDSVREVDIIVGCYLLIRRSLWDELGGFNPKYYMYGEDADLCLRARAKGWKPMITPDSQIMHLVGASTKSSGQKAVQIMKGRATLIRDHWPKVVIPIGIGLMWLWVALRFAIIRVARYLLPDRFLARDERWSILWRARKYWLAGYS